MKNKTFIAIVLVIVGCWMALQITRNNSRYRIMRNRHQQISVARTEIGKIKDSLDLSGEGDPGVDQLLMPALKGDQDDVEVSLEVGWQREFAP